VAKVQIPRAELASLVGLPADASEEALHAAVRRRLAALDDETTQRAEDRGIVAAAINAGKFSRERASFWLNALQANRPGTRTIIASLASGLPTVARKVSAADLAAGAPTVSASASQSEPPVRVVDMLGQQVPGVPDPVRISRGTPPSEWTHKQHSDHFQRQLGQRFWPGTEAPPRSDVWYQPSPNDVTEFVDDGKGGFWREKNPYREIPKATHPKETY
jgi:hypothetical protein